MYSELIISVNGSHRDTKFGGKLKYVDPCILAFAHAVIKKSAFVSYA